MNRRERCPARAFPHRGHERFKTQGGNRVCLWCGDTEYGTRDGGTYDPARGGLRLGDQHARVFGLMEDGAWRTLDAIATETGDPAASVSARLRDFRKDRFGGHTVERRHVEKGLWEYRLIVKPNEGGTDDE